MKKVLSALMVFTMLIALLFTSCKKKSESSTPAPVASFTVTNGGCTGPCIVGFTNTSQNATSYSWDFGDGSDPVTEANPTHEFAVAGTYTVKLTATGSGGNHSATSNVIIGGSKYYITYKEGGKTFTYPTVTATRDESSSPKVLNLMGEPASGSQPSFTLKLSEPPAVGFSPGVNVSIKSSNLTLYSIIHVNSSGVSYNTAYHAEGIDMFFSELSFTSGGEARGTFSGKVKTSGGVEAVITQGKFFFQFSN